MTPYRTRSLCVALALLMLSGCSSRESASTVSVADIGGGVSYTTAQPYADEPLVTAEEPAFSAEEQETTTAAESAGTSSEPQEAVPEQPEPQKAQSTSVSSEPEPVAVTTTKKTTPATEKTTARTTSEKTTTSETTTSNEKPSEPVVIETPSDMGSSSYAALNYSEIKGVWISYIELAELLQGQTAAGFRSRFAAVLDNCADISVNTVYVHVRSHSDAYYASELFPWSKYVTGTVGKDPGFDPLEIMLEEAHKRSISFQAWINPLRVCGTSAISGYAGTPVYSFASADGMAGKYAVDVNGTYYLNPAYNDVTELIAAGAAEIIAKYDVDGLHIDDYFYPTTEEYFDSSAYASSGSGSLSEFRFANCDRMVSGLYSAVKGANPSALFSVSVQGRIDNNYTQLYADVRKWCTSPGYLDVMIPQIYYGFENSAAPYNDTLDDWEALAVKGGIKLAVGLSVSKVGVEDTWAGSGKYEWINNSDILSRQLAEAKKCRSYSGFVLYSYRSIFSPESSVSAAVSREISALVDLI